MAMTMMTAMTMMMNQLEKVQKHQRAHQVSAKQVKKKSRAEIYELLDYICDSIISSTGKRGHGQT